MEILFRNECFGTKEWAKECYRYSFFRRPLIFFFNLWGVLLIGYALYELLFLRIINVPAFCGPAFYFAAVLFAYFRSVKMTLRRDKEIYGDCARVATEVTDDAIVQTLPNGGQLTLPLDRATIKRCVRTRHYILLISDAKLIYTLEKGGFSVGSEEEFLAFLRDKGIKIR